MKLLMVVSALALAGCAVAANERARAQAPAAIEAPSGRYTLDPTHSSLIVRVSHFGLSHYTLRLTGLTATLEFNAQTPTQSTLVATAAANTVETEYPGARPFNDELEGPEWLDAANHPEISFRSTGVVLTGRNTGRMSGDLTLRGVTRPVSFDVTYNNSYARHPFNRPLSQIGFSARGEINRSEFGMNAFLPAPPANVGVGDRVELVIEAEFNRPLTT